MSLFEGRLYCPEEGEGEIEDEVAEEEDGFLEEEFCHRREVDILQWLDLILAITISEI